MREKNRMPIVGLTDYGLLGVLLEYGGRLYLCSPHLPPEKMTAENANFLCMQGDELSPLEMFMILMWTMENAVIGGYITNVEDGINFLKTNGISMRPGKLNLIFNVNKDQHGSHRLYSLDDRDIVISHCEDLESMAEAFYNTLLKMKEEYGVTFNVALEFRGDEGRKFGEILKKMHSLDNFNLAIIN